MRIVWKDSTKPKRPLKYRGVMITGCGDGWAIDIQGDDNIYKAHYCAKNAIDAALGGTGAYGKADEKRLSYGIQIIGKK